MRDQDIKPLQKMQLVFADLWIFIRDLLKRWFFWLFLLVDIVAVIAQYINPHFQLPQPLYIIFALCVFAFSAFAVYRDLLIASRKNISSVPPLPVSKLSLSFVEGNEYIYRLDNPYDKKHLTPTIFDIQRNNDIQSRWEKDIFFVDDVIYYCLPRAYVVLNLRIENTGDIPIDIIALNARSSGEIPAAMLIYLEESHIGSKLLSFPIHLDKNNIVAINLDFKITTDILKTEAQFFADFRLIKKSFALAINLDTINDLAKKQEYKITNEIAWRPLVDLYVNQLRKYLQKEYLRLAGYTFE